MKKKYYNNHNYIAMISNTESNIEIISYINNNNDNKKVLAKSINKMTLIPIKSIFYILNNAENNKHSDAFIYNLLKKSLKIKKDTNIEERAKHIAEDISKLLDGIDYSFGNLLDVGCGDSSISIELCKKLKMDEIPYCVDVEDWFGNYKEKGECNFKYIKDNKIDFDNNKFDVVIAIQSLHHMENFNEMINEISRVIKSGGILIIKEHDCKTYYDKLYIDIHHSIYELVLKEQIQENYIDKYFAKYYTFDYLSFIFKELNFELLKMSKIKNNLKSYYAIFRKK